MKTCIMYLVENKGTGLLVLNMFLLMIALILRDPFSLFVSTYTKAKPWIEKDDSIQELSIQKVTNQVVGDVAKIWLEEHLDEKDEKVSLWKMELTGVTYILSNEKIASLLEHIYDTRQFTALGGEKSDYGLERDYTILGFHSASGKSQTWKIAPSGDGGGGSYLLDDKDNIFFIPISYSHLLGRGSVTHLVEKKLFPEENLSRLVSIQLEIAGQKKWQLGREEDNWYLQGKEIQLISKDKWETHLGNLIDLQAMEVFEAQDAKALKKISPIKILFGINRMGVPSIRSLQCGSQDREGNYFCGFNDRGGVFSFGRYEIESITNLGEKDFR